jgi:hypothetical protein
MNAGESPDAVPALRSARRVRFRRRATADGQKRASRRRAAAVRFYVQQQTGCSSGDLRVCVPAHGGLPLDPLCTHDQIPSIERDQKRPRLAGNAPDRRLGSAKLAPRQNHDQAAAGKPMYLRNELKGALRS